MSAGYETLTYEIGGPGEAVCSITLNRPDQRNAINRQMAEELIDAFTRVRDEEAVKVVVLAGAGKSFCVGGDLTVLPTLDHGGMYDWMARTGYECTRAIAENEKIVVAKIHGHCIAGGLELALACDLQYAEQQTKFGVTEITMGILPGWGGTVRLARNMPISRAKELLLTGRRDYRAAELFELGLLTRVCAEDQLDSTVDSVVEQIAGNAADALRMAKSVANRAAEGLPSEAAYTIERNAIAWLYHSEFAGNLRTLALSAMQANSEASSEER
jgi:enoyl-CoA hydratase/carnithine racemase